MGKKGEAAVPGGGEAAIAVQAGGQHPVFLSAACPVTASWG